jgi:hypothetical protein
VGHRTLSLIVIAVTLALDVTCGVVFAAAEHIAVWHGIYCALANAETFGGDVSPTTPLGYAVNFTECLLLIPLSGAVLSLATSGLTERHVRRHVQAAVRDIQGHVTAALSPRGE